MKRFALALLLTTPLIGQTVDVPPASPIARQIRALVVRATGPAASHVRSFYGANGYRPVWTRDRNATSQALALIAVLEQADTRGLTATDYSAGRWSARVAALGADTTTDGAAFDVELTYAVLRYLSDVSIGRIDTQTAGLPFDRVPPLYLPALVHSAAEASDPASVLARAEPRHPQYRLLIDALAQYRTIARGSGRDAALPRVAKLAPGDSYQALPELAERLRVLGDLPQQPRSNPAGTPQQPNVYEGAIVEAVRAFQLRHGLEPDGIVSAKTFAQLEVPAAARVAQIEWALERWRWIPDSEANARAIVVNIPEFLLRAYDQSGCEQLTMRIVAGAPHHATPMIASEMRNVVFRPYWSVPSGIQRNEIVPHVMRDATYLARNNYELTGTADDLVEGLRSGALRARQKPGASNALGLVKFIFPNDRNIYLHSTPSQSHFARSRRDLSHGCIRLQDPAALAAWSLEGWSRERVEAAMHGDRDDVYVRLDTPIAIRIVYATAAVHEGRVHFFADIYGHDAALARLLTPSRGGGAGVVAAR